MIRLTALVSLWLGFSCTLCYPATNAWPDNIVADGIPPIPDQLKQELAPYMEFRSASFQSWNPLRREMLITTRFADSPQLHQVRGPGADRRQMTFLPEPVGGGSWRPRSGKEILFSQDVGGGEFFQLFRFEPESAKITLLTDGKSRNTGAVWARSGKKIAFSSTRRTGQDTDIYTMDPARPDSLKLVREVSGGGWGAVDWSHDETKLLIVEYVSIAESYLHLLDLKTGQMQPVTPRTGAKVSYGGGEFLPGDKELITTSDQNSEFRRLARLDLKSQTEKALLPDLKWDVEQYDLSPKGDLVAFTSNEEGSSVLQMFNLKTGKTNEMPKLKKGVVTGLTWDESGEELGFTFSSARSSADAYSYSLETKKVVRWTESETGGLDSSKFVEPELVRFKSFDQREITAFHYHPATNKFPGKRPVVIIIHGGPESQIRPIFQARNNFLINELGVALITPNVRGSAGYGKSFLDLDNGFRREDSVKDIGALLDWIATQSDLDSERVAVMGGSYGGYMVLASMTHFSHRLRAGIDIVGISNFLTFLKNTQSYRRDLRRAEYGDERDPKMAEHLEQISPLSSVHKITKPLLIIQGKNDPRVPYTEAEQILSAVRKNNGTAWYLLASDEGHGFAKKRNQDLQTYVTILFLRQHLLD